MVGEFMVQITMILVEITIQEWLYLPKFYCYFVLWLKLP